MMRLKYRYVQVDYRPWEDPEIDMGASTDEDEENEAYVVVPEDGDNDPSKEVSKTMFWKGQTSSKSVAQSKPSLTSRRSPTPPPPPPPPPPSSKGSTNPDSNRIRKRSKIPETNPINDFGEDEYLHQHDTQLARTPFSFSMGDLKDGGDRKFLETPKTTSYLIPNPQPSI